MGFLCQGIFIILPKTKKTANSKTATATIRMLMRKIHSKILRSNKSGEGNYVVNKTRAPLKR